MCQKMDKRLKSTPPTDVQMEHRHKFYASISKGELSIAQAVVAMRKMSQLTQPEFAKHRGISVQALRQIESGTGNPTVETLNKIAAIFTLQVGFCIPPSGAVSGRPKVRAASSPDSATLLKP
jgi:DNA-binding XRE family transcriptional regulator